MKFHAAYFFLRVILLVMSSATALAVDLSSVAESKEWKSLLFVTEYHFLNLQSRADSEKFFLTPNGKKNILSELEAAVVAVENEKLPLNDSSFSCRFPARAEFIRKNIFNQKRIDESGCLKLLAWRERISAESVTLVFSSYFLGNPSSTFGHTLLRINNSGKNKTIRRELLSYGINYGANAWTKNPLFYSLYGLFGVFQGNFSAIPYYYKVREYNDYESRDLWEYDLDLTPDEVFRVVDVIWEQGENYFDYFFLSENCGYYIGALVEAAAPRFQLTEKFRKWVIPSDTVVQFQKSGAIKSRKVRTSIYNQFAQRLGQLNSEQENILIDLHEMAENLKDQNKELNQLDWPQSFEKTDDQSKAQILDAELDYYDYIHSKELLEKPDFENTTKKQLLIRRSQLPVAQSLPVQDVTLSAPENAHGSYRWQIAALKTTDRNNISNESNSLLLAGRFAFHDLEDPKQGYPDDSHIEVMNLKLHYDLNSDHSEKLKLYEMKIAEIGSYPNWNRWANKKSNDVSFGLFRETNFICDDCLTGQFRFAYGISKVFSKFRFSILAQAKYMYGEFNLNHHNGWNYFGLGPRFIMQYDYNSDYQMRFETQHQTISTAENKLWSADIVFRRNFFNEYAIELGASTNEIQNIFNASVYSFTF